MARRGSEITPPAADVRPGSPHPSPFYERLALERLTPKEASYVGNVGGVDRPLEEVSLGFGEVGYVGVRDVLRPT